MGRYRGIHAPRDLINVSKDELIQQWGLTAKEVYHLPETLPSLLEHMQEETDGYVE
jgi:hypothetical protein